MKLFTVGPVEMYERTKQQASRQLPYFRTIEFSHTMFSIQERLKTFVQLANGYVVPITGSGTAAMEAVCACSFRSHHRVLIINGGSFGERFSSICDCYHIPHDDILLPYPQPLQQSDLDAIDGSKYDAILVNLHETSTGQLYNMRMLTAFAQKYHLYIIVDAISAFIADDIQMDHDAIDVLILSSQKALALAPGLSMIAIQERFYQKMIEPKEDICQYLSIKLHVANMKRGQTPFTPAVGILLDLEDRLTQLEHDGFLLEQQVIRERAMYFRNRIKAFQVNIPSFPLSNALTPIYIENRAEGLFHYLKDKGFMLTPSGGALQPHLLRVGHLGNLQLKDYDELIQAMEEYGL